ncbi:MAG TPA: response regulator [Chloroflexota bacterium]|nr:response regulator [Chloroflexota bacterium]
MSQRVLVVEDNDMNFTLVQFVLQRLGLDVQRAKSGPEALDLVEAGAPDLIYMDIHLPGMDGLEVTRHLRAKEMTRKIPIVALTALAMAGDQERALQAGCDGYLTKPVSANDLRESVSRYLEGAAGKADA